MLEQVGRALAPVPLLATLVLGALPVAEFGSAAQRAELLGPVIAGESVLTAALLEAGDGLPPAVPAVSARPVAADGAGDDGEGWILDGEKELVPAAHLADRILVPARTGDGATTVFVLDPSAAGVSIERQVSTNLDRSGTFVSTGPGRRRRGARHGGRWGRDRRVITDRAVAGGCALRPGCARRPCGSPPPTPPSASSSGQDRHVPGGCPARRRCYTTPRPSAHVSPCGLAARRGARCGRRHLGRQVLGGRRRPAGRPCRAAPARRHRDGCELSGAPLLPVGKAPRTDPRRRNPPSPTIGEEHG